MQSTACNGVERNQKLSKWQSRLDNTEYDRAYHMLVPKVDSKKFLDLPNRKSFCLILQIQTGYSKLKDYRYKLGQCDSKKCTCREPEHFLMDCPNYQHYRETMQLKLSSQLGLNFLYAHTLLSCLLNLCLDDRIGLSGMLVYHLLYIFPWYSQVLHVSS